MIIQHMDLKGKALFLTLASSGMRIGESLSLTLNDIDLEHDPVSIQIRGENTKTGEQRFTFISSEAKEALIEWLKVRGAYMEQAHYKNAGFLACGFSGPRPNPEEDNRIFPFAMKTAQDTWRLAIKSAGLRERDPATGRYSLHIHQLRKFFRSQLALAVPVDIVEMLMAIPAISPTLTAVSPRSRWPNTTRRANISSRSTQSKRSAGWKASSEMNCRSNRRPLCILPPRSNDMKKNSIPCVDS